MYKNCIVFAVGESIYINRGMYSQHKRKNDDFRDIEAQRLYKMYSLLARVIWF